VSDKTRLTEIVTGLGMLGGQLRAELPARPGELRNLDDETWAGVVDAWDRPELAALADAAFANGRFFLEATDALRGRRPRLVEWAGPRRAPGDEVAPVDLRVDHVYLVSCKYLSRITVNASPSHLLDRLLTGGHGRRAGDWYREVAPTEHDALWAAARRWLDDPALPTEAAALTKDQRRSVAKRLTFRAWPDELAPAYASLCAAAAERSAARWAAAVEAAGPGAAEALVWRMLRIGSAPYFVLGAHSSTDALRLRVASPWDWRQAFRFRRLDVAPLAGGQPMVTWRAVVADRATGGERVVEGHVELRWSHGRFSGPPEAKVYLDTPFAEVPGYWPLA